MNLLEKFQAWRATLAAQKRVAAFDDGFAWAVIQLQKGIATEELYQLIEKSDTEYSKGARCALRNLSHIPS